MLVCLVRLHNEFMEKPTLVFIIYWFIWKLVTLMLNLTLMCLVRLHNEFMAGPPLLFSDFFGNVHTTLSISLYFFNLKFYKKYFTQWAHVNPDQQVFHELASSGLYRVYWSWICSLSFLEMSTLIFFFLPLIIWKLGFNKKIEHRRIANTRKYSWC